MGNLSLSTRLGALLRGKRSVGPLGIHAANGAVFDIHALRVADRVANQAIIRSLCRNAYLGDGSSLARVLGRYKMFLDTRDAGLSPHLMLDGFWEMWHTEAMVDRVKPGMKAVDAGANLGYFSLLLADLVGANGSVHAFEPNPEVARHLRGNLAINGFDARVTAHEVALSDASGTATMWVPEGQPMNGNLNEARGRPLADIATRRLDSYPELLDTDFIKIDVEGAEEKMWEGMSGLFAQRRPLTIFLEFLGRRYSDPAAFVDRLMAHDFEMGLIDSRAGIVAIDAATLLAQSPDEDQMVVLTR